MYDFGAHRQWPLTLHFKLRKLHFHVTHTHTSSLSLNVSQVLEIASFVRSLTSLSSLQLLLSEQWTRSYNLSKSNADIIVWAFPKSNSMVTHPAQFSSVSNDSHLHTEISVSQSLSIIWSCFGRTAKMDLCVQLVNEKSCEEATTEKNKKLKHSENRWALCSINLNIWTHKFILSFQSRFSFSVNLRFFLASIFWCVFRVCVCVYLLC